MTDHLNALDRVATALGFDMDYDEARHRYRFVHVESGLVLRTTWVPPWRHDRKTQTITCQHGRSWTTNESIPCEACNDPDKDKASEEAVFNQTALQAVEEMWAVATTGRPQPLVS